MAKEAFIGSLVQTKCVPPKQREGLLARHRISDKIIGHLDRRLVVVSTPAGYGKTSLLTQVWEQLKETRTPASWLSVERDDNDLARFVAYLVDAVQSTGLNVGSATNALLRLRLHLTPEAITTTLLNELAAIDTDIYIFLDDYHLIDEESVCDLVSRILLAPLEKVHFIVGSRSSVRLPVSRLRALGEVYELDSSMLAFSAEEAEQYLSSLHVPLSPEQIAFIHDRTEGWITGLQLAQLALEHGEAPDTVITTMSGRRRTIGEFLADDVFRHQPKELQDFLLASSVFERFNAELCNGLMLRNDSQQMIERISAANLFILSLDHEGRWYRYHHLFSEFLRRRLRDLSADNWIALQQRASSTLLDAGFLTEAIQHSLAAKDIHTAAEILNRASRDLFASGQISTLRALARRLPECELKRQPLLQLELAWEYVIRWEFPAARQALDSVRNVLTSPKYTASENEIEYHDQLRSELSHRQLMLSIFTDDLVTADIEVRDWLERHNVDDMFMHASACTAQVLCNRELHSCDISKAACADMHELFVEANAVYGVVFFFSMTGKAFFARSSLNDAEEKYRRGLGIGKTLHGTGSPLAAMPAVLLAELLYERNMLDDVRDLLDTYPMEAAKLGFVDNLIPNFVLRSRMAFMSGESAAAADFLLEGRSVAQRYGFRRLDLAVVSEQIRQYVVSGDTASIDQITQEAGITIDALANEQRFSAKADIAIILTRCLVNALNRDTPSEAEKERAEQMVKTLRGLFSTARERNCNRSAVHIGIQLASLAFRLYGLTNDVIYYTSQVLRTASEIGLVRSLVDEGRTFGVLLRSVADSEDASLPLDIRRYMSVLLQEHFRTDGLDERYAGHLVTEPLTSREIEVLRLGLDSRTNKESAHLLGLTQNTIKWYWQQIFRKLDVNRRSQAIRKARHLNLI